MFTLTSPPDALSSSLFPAPETDYIKPAKSRRFPYNRVCLPYLDALQRLFPTVAPPLTTRIFLSACPWNTSGSGSK